MPRTIHDVLTTTHSLISQLDAELLLAHIIDTSREWIVSHPETSLSRWQVYRFHRLLKKRVLHTPLAYLTGEKAFYGLFFEVNRHTLVPRPETEILVDAAVQTISSISPQSVTLINVGTGSGCIPISILHHLLNTPVNIYATDISRNALSVARRNAMRYGAPIIFRRGNLLDPFRHDIAQREDGSHLVITANLPYLTEEQLTEPSISREPRTALYAEDGGLAYYKELLDGIDLLPGEITAFFEIDPTQTDRIVRYIEKKFPGISLRVILDLSGRNRVIEVHHGGHHSI